jgi:hypothetical protein
MARQLHGLALIAVILMALLILAPAANDTELYVRDESTSLNVTVAECWHLCACLGTVE